MNRFGSAVGLSGSRASSNLYGDCKAIPYDDFDPLKEDSCLDNCIKIETDDNKTGYLKSYLDLDFLLKSNLIFITAINEVVIEEEVTNCNKNHLVNNISSQQQAKSVSTSLAEPINSESINNYLMPNLFEFQPNSSNYHLNFFNNDVLYKKYLQVKNELLSSSSSSKLSPISSPFSLDFSENNNSKTQSKNSSEKSINAKENFEIDIKNEIKEIDDFSESKYDNSTYLAPNHGSNSSAIISPPDSPHSLLKQKRSKRGQYRKYESDQLGKAVDAVMSGAMSVHKAGSHFGVPHSTLEYKVREKTSSVGASVSPFSNNGSKIGEFEALAKKYIEYFNQQSYMGHSYGQNLNIFNNPFQSSLFNNSLNSYNFLNSIYGRDSSLSASSLYDYTKMSLNLALSNKFFTSNI